MRQNFTVEVKPTISALKQHAAFDGGDVLFDWTEFEIPSGGAKLIGVTALYRPKGDTDPTPNAFPMELIFGRVGATLGAPNAVFNAATPTEDIMGLIKVLAGSAGATATSTTCIATSTGNSVVISSDPTNPLQGSNVGVQKFYVAGIATGAFNFVTATNIIAADGAASATLTCDGTGADLRQHFLPGDIISTGTAVGGIAAGTLLGTVKTVGSATAITLTATSTTALKDGMLLYNTRPIKLLLHFEK